MTAGIHPGLHAAAICVRDSESGFYTGMRALQQARQHATGEVATLLDEAIAAFNASEAPFDRAVALLDTMTGHQHFPDRSLPADR